MTATNHALTGALIGLSVTQPAVALPLAFVSHFILDAVPHFGGIEYFENEKKRWLFHLYLKIDALLLTLVIAWLFLAGVGWLVFGCLFLAGCPDFVHAYNYLFNKRFRRDGPGPKKNWFTKFHKNIQWSETSRGIIVEIPFAVAVSILIINSI